LFTKRQDKEAIASLKTALSLNPNDPQISRGLGFVLTYVGYPEEGCSNLMMARRLNPRADDTPLGISLYLSGRYDDAAEVLSGKHRWGALYLAAANGQLGNLEEARTAFQRFIDGMQAEARLRGEPEPSSKQILSLEFADLRRESDRTHMIDGLRKAELNDHQK
jgi:tetratricopeptide (TPR) repeat protein